MTEEEAIAALKTFLDNNPKSSVKKIQTLSGRSAVAVVNPWGDSSLAIEIGTNAEKLIPALNGLMLPERLSALYHINSRQLEVMWTAYRLSPNNAAVPGRKFTFRYQDTVHECEFRRASNELLTIAPNYEPQGPSDINYRNIASFESFVTSGRSAQSEGSRFGEPLCFFISNIDYSEDAIVKFLMSLNFYMSYYDALTPRVLIHPPAATKGPDGASTRFRHRDFPSSIGARTLDPELLQFWSACFTNEPARQFLYAYRIIEHAAFFFVESAPKIAVRKALSLPNALDDVAGTADRVLAAVRMSKIDEYQRLEQLAAQCVEPEGLWEVISAHMDAFSRVETFDGGFELQPLVEGKGSEREFKNSGVRSFCSIARRIRNALSHGREERNATVITPTKQNYDKLRPWASLITRAAGDVILYEHA